MRGRRLTLLGFCLIGILISAAPAVADDAAWKAKMAEARALGKAMDYMAAAERCEEALPHAPSAFYAAETLRLKVQYLEAAPDRDAAIKAWLRLAAEYPESRHTTEAWYRLGKLHTSMETARAYFEKAIAVGPWCDEHVLNSKMSLAGIYYRLGQPAKADALRLELATMDVDAIPRREGAQPDWSFSSNERKTRRNVSRVRYWAARRIVALALGASPQDPIATLEALVARYPGTEIEAQALFKMAEIAREKGVTLSRRIDLVPFARELRHSEGFEHMSTFEYQKTVHAEFARLYNLLCDGSRLERDRAVRELVGLRQAVSDAVCSIFSDAEAGRASDGARRSAVCVTGALRLAACVDFLERLGDWEYRAGSREEAMGLMEVIREPRTTGRPSEALQRARLCDDVMINPAPSAALSDYPALAEALSELRSDDYKVRGSAVSRVYIWHNTASIAFRRLAKNLKAKPNARIAAAFLAGEYRGYLSRIKEKVKKLRDPERISFFWPQTLIVINADPEKPFETAVRKAAYKEQEEK